MSLDFFDVVAQNEKKEAQGAYPHWPSMVWAILRTQVRNYNKTVFAPGAIKFQCKDVVPADKVLEACETLASLGLLAKLTTPKGEYEFVDAPKE